MMKKIRSPHCMTFDSDELHEDLSPNDNFLLKYLFYFGFAADGVYQCFVACCASNSLSIYCDLPSGTWEFYLTSHFT